MPKFQPEFAKLIRHWLYNLVGKTGKLKESISLFRRFVISIRDILSWVQFINSCCTQNQVLTDNDMDVSDTAIKTAITAEKAYIHGCCLVLVDSIGSGNTALHAGTCESVKEECLRFLKKQIGSICDINDASRIENGNECFGIPPFTIQRGKYVVYLNHAWFYMRYLFV